jgi:hypothetical protein
MKWFRSPIAVDGTVSAATPTQPEHLATKDYVDSKSNAGVWPPDAVPTTPSAYDYEFEGSGTDLPSGWSWINRGTSTYLEKNGAGYLTAQSSSGWNNRGIYRSIDTASAFEYRAKFRLVAVRNTNYFQAGLFITDGTKLVNCVYDNRGAKYFYWNSVTSHASESAGYPLMIGSTIYISLQKNSATSWNVGYSTDGEIYEYYFSNVNFSSFLPSPTGIGFLFQNESNVGKQTVACDWFRKVA